jgi:hypothetical protein
VATVRERDGRLRYGVREPALSGAGERALEHFEEAELRRPLTDKSGL